ncbi:MAG: hypothetical protein WA021_04945 [Minisyncoccia bacterium]
MVTIPFPKWLKAALLAILIAALTLLVSEMVPIARTNAQWMRGIANWWQIVTSTQCVVFVVIGIASGYIARWITG